MPCTTSGRRHPRLWPALATTFGQLKYLGMVFKIHFKVFSIRNPALTKRDLRPSFGCIECLGHLNN